MAEQIDLWPDTLMTPEKRLDERIDTYIALWRADHRPATLAHLRPIIDERLELERRNLA